MGNVFGKSLWDCIFPDRSFHIAMLGLDSSGKTTALYRLKLNQYVNSIPTIGFNCEKIKLDLRGLYNEGDHRTTVTFCIWDIGGQDKLRSLWRSYSRCADGIVFVIDSCDDERLEEAKMELQRLARSPEIMSVPILVLANKQDLPSAKEPSEIAHALAMNELTAEHHLWYIQPTCAIIGDGIKEGLQQLYIMILKQREMRKRTKSSGGVTRR